MALDPRTLPDASDPTGGGAVIGGSGTRRPNAPNAQTPFPTPVGSMAVPADITAPGVANELDRMPTGQFQDYLNAMMAGATRGPRASPYDAVMADRTRAPQQALYAQLLAQAQGGPSVSGLQAQMAGDQSVQAQAAAMAGGRGGLGGLQAMNQGARINSGLAGQAGENRLAETMQQAGLSAQGTGGMRGRDIQSMAAQANAGLQQRALDDAATRFYVSQGLDLASAQRQAALERYKFHRRLTNQIRQRQDQTAADFMQVAGSVLGAMGLQGAGQLGSAGATAVTSGDRNGG